MTLSEVNFDEKMPRSNGIAALLLIGYLVS